MVARIRAVAFEQLRMLLGLFKNHTVQQAFGALILLPLWQWLGGENWSRPTAILADVFSNSDYRTAIPITLAHAAKGLSAGFVVGIALSISCCLVKNLSVVLRGPVLLAGSIPILGLVKLLSSSQPSVDQSPIWSAAILAFYPTYVLCSLGVASYTKEQIQLFQVLGGGRLQRLLKLQLPLALPYGVHILRAASVSALLGAMLGEFGGAGDRGLGKVLQIALFHGASTARWSVAICIYGISAFSFLLLAFISSRLERSGFVCDVAKLTQAGASTAHPYIEGGARRTLRRTPIKSLCSFCGHFLSLLMSFELVSRCAGWSFFLQDSSFTGWGLATETWARLFMHDRDAVFDSAMAGSFGYAIAGLVTAGIVASALSMLFFFVPGTRGFLQPAVLVFQLTPMVAFVPVIVGLMGRSWHVEIALAVSAVFYRMFEVLDLPMKHGPVQLGQFFAVSGARKIDELRFLRIPLMIRMMRSAFVTSSPLAIQGVILAEFLVTSRGLGYAFSAGVSRPAVLIALCLNTMFISYVLTSVLTRTLEVVDKKLSL